MSERPTIEFPCRYPIKVIGVAAPNAARDILAVVRLHAPEVTPDDVTRRNSRKGKYASIGITIVATGEEQLKALHRDLMALASVKMVL